MAVADRSPAVPARAPRSKKRRRSVGDVFRAEEVKRARVFFRALTVVLGVLGIALLFLPGPPWLRGVTAALVVVLLVLCGLTILALRQARRYTPKLVTAVGTVCAVGGVLIIYYLGLFSAAASILTVGIYFFGLSSSKLAARTVYGCTAISYLILTAAIAAGVVPDESLFPSDHVRPISRWYRVAMMQVVFALTFFLARSGQRSTEHAIDRVRQAWRQLKQRDAQLAEARNELDWALRTGEGQMTGQTIRDYRIEVMLGRGGMGEVYSAEHLPSGKKVALKVLHANMVENDEYVQRFMQEAQAAAAVPSEHVAEVYELGTTPLGVPFISMELLDGHDLAWHLRKTEHGRLPLETVVTMVEHAAQALAAVREAGVVHRDLKPANLFLVDSLPQKWKVLDFGLSKIQGGAALTREVAMGTPQYMPPEQAQGLHVDHRADLYALAALAYRTLTGQPPFVGEEIGPLLLDVLYTQPQQPGAFVRLPVEVELVLAIALAKKPDDRFACVEDFADALRYAATGDLDAETRAYGWGLVKQYPWGTTTRHGQEGPRSQPASGRA